MGKVLSEAQVEHFIDRGYVKLDGAFPRERALAAQDFLWGKLAERGVRRDDQATWTEPMVHIKESYSDPAFGACASERLADAIEDLVGEGRWATRGKPAGWGWWPVNFAQGADQPWDVPTRGWHWDGQHFRHFVDSPEQGLLLLCMFSEIDSKGGGTLVAAGSHAVTARFLAEQSAGLELGEAIAQCRAQHPWLAALCGLEGAARPSDRVAHFMEQATVDEHGTALQVVETTAQPGDVILCHPFLFHSASSNHLGRPRFMCNRTTPLKARMAFDRPEGDYSAVEISIRRALGKDRTSRSG